MFTQVALRACVFILKCFFCEIQCFDWTKCDSTHTDLRQFSTMQNQFFWSSLGAQSLLGEHGPLRCRKAKDLVNCMIKLWFNFILDLNFTFPCFKLVFMRRNLPELFNVFLR